MWIPLCYINMLLSEIKPLFLSYVNSNPDLFLSTSLGEHACHVWFFAILCLFHCSAEQKP